MIILDGCYTLESSRPRQDTDTLDSFNAASTRYRVARLRIDRYLPLADGTLPERDDFLLLVGLSYEF